MVTYITSLLVPENQTEKEKGDSSDIFHDFAKLFSRVHYRMLFKERSLKLITDSYYY